MSPAYFATHLHADHVGDFAQVWIGSWAGGRSKPLVMYGPFGAGAEIRHEAFRREAGGVLRLGHRYAASACFPMRVPKSKCMNSISPRPASIYDKNGVVIKSFPAIHIYDGPVSFRLEWNGLCFVFSG